MISLLTTNGLLVVYGVGLVTGLFVRLVQSRRGGEFK